MPVTVVMVFRLLRQGQPRAAWLLSMSVVGASLVTHIMKLLLARPRLDLHAALTAMPADASFPGAHVAQITAFVVAILFLSSRESAFGTASIGMVLTTAVGLSRIYLQVHYTSDVVAGALLGVFWVCGIRQSFQL